MTSTASDTSCLPNIDPIPDATVQAYLGTQLRVLYNDPDEERMPRRLTQLVDCAVQVVQAHMDLVDQALFDGIKASLKSLRAYALALTRDIHRAEGLVQETVLKVISKQEQFEAGTNLQAWPFTILRNIFIYDRRSTQSE